MELLLRYLIIYTTIKKFKLKIKVIIRNHGNEYSIISKSVAFSSMACISLHYLQYIMKHVNCVIIIKQQVMLDFDE